MGWEQIPLKPVSRSFLLLLFAYYPCSAELFVNILKIVSPVTVLLRPVVTFSQKHWMLHEYQSTLGFSVSVFSFLSAGSVLRESERAWADTGLGR